MSALYDKAREAYLSGALNWLTDDVRAILIDSADYTPNLATHDFLDDIPSGARVAVSPSLTGKSATNGVADAAGTTFSLVSGDQSEVVVLYKHTGTESTSRLIAFVDTFSSGMPVTPNGGDITLAWATGSSKIFKL